MGFGQIWWIIIIIAIAAFLIAAVSHDRAKAGSAKNADSKTVSDSSPAPPDEDASGSEPAAAPLIMQAVDIGCGKNIRYATGGSYMTRRIEWRSASDSDNAEADVRTPQPEIKGYPAVGGFHAAGKRYAGLHQLKHQQIDDSPRWLDIHGREVICVSERFPCFDSYDHLHEDRYFDWFILRENDRFTIIYHADETLVMYITEDARDIEIKCADRLRELGYLI